MKKFSLFCLMFLSCMSLVFAASRQSVDEEIAALENRKVELESLAKFHGREADRLLFINYQDYLQAVGNQERDLAELHRVETRLAELKAKRGR